MPGHHLDIQNFLLLKCGKFPSGQKYNMNQKINEHLESWSY